MPVFVNERADYRRLVAVENVPQIRAVFSAPDLILANVQKKALNLVVQFLAVSDDDNAAVVHVLTNPLGQPYHNQ